MAVPKNKFGRIFGCVGYFLIYNGKIMKFMKLNLDLKSIMILVLLGFSIIFFGMWYFRGSDKDKVKVLENEIEQIQIKRDSLRRANDVLNVDLIRIQNDIKAKDYILSIIRIKLSEAENKLTSANSRLSDVEKMLRDSKKRVLELEKNPIRREGDELINSLKEKLK